MYSGWTFGVLAVLEEWGAHPGCTPRNRTSRMATLTLLHSQTFPIGRYSDAFHAASISPRPVESLDRLGPDGSALRVVLIDPAILTGRAFSPDARTAVVGVGLSEQPSWLSDETVYFHLPENPAAPLL